MSSLLDAPRFSEIRLPATDWRICIMSCPGVRFSRGTSVVDEAFLKEDLKQMDICGTGMVLSCMQASELALGTELYAREYATRGLFWHIIEIPDMSPPASHHDSALDDVFDQARAVFAAGNTVAIHCMAGLGRSGTVAGRLAMRCGLTGDQAIAFIRERHDPGAIETAQQEDYLRNHVPLQQTAAD